MSTSPIETIARRLGVVPDHRTLAGSMSGASVRRVRRQDGTPAVLKVTRTSTPGAGLAAERELAFYRDIQPTLTIRAPRLLGHVVLDDTTAILLTAHPSSRPAPTWTLRRWLELAADLAVLHQTPVPDGDLWRHAGPIPGGLTSAQLEAARATWTSAEERRLLDAVLEDVDSLRETLEPTEEVFVHGDCHTDNILLEPDGLVWTDWQSAGRGRPAEELAFCSVRAVPSGTVPPLPGMIDVYAARRGLDAEKLARSVTAAELMILLLAWPPYAAYNDAAGIQRIHRRVGEVGHAWFAR